MLRRNLLTPLKLPALFYLIRKMFMTRRMRKKMSVITPRMTPMLMMLMGV